MSWIYAAAAGLNCAAEIVFDVWVQFPLLSCRTQTRVRKFPAMFAREGRMGSNPVYVMTRRTSSEKKKKVFFLSVL